MGKIEKKKMLFLIFTSFYSYFLFADVIPNIPQLEKELQEPRIKGVVSSRIEFKNERKIEIKKFKITGNKKVSLSEIEKITKEYEGKEITVSELKIISDKITEIYWNKGYITSFAYVPPQKIIDGIVEINVIEGKAGKIKIEGNKYYTNTFIENHFEKVKKEEVLNNRTLERSLLILNEYPKLNVNVNLTKGEELGLTDLIINVKEKSYPFNFSIFGNNYGSRYTGRPRVGFTFDLGNLTKHGDVLSLTGIGNIQDLDSMNYYKIGYTLPLMGTGAKIGVSWSHMKYMIDKELNPLEVEGKSDIYSLFLSYPFIRSRFQNLSLFASLNYKDMKNYLFEKTYLNSDDRYSTLEIGLQRDRLYTNSHLYWTAKATFGLGTFFGGMSDEEYTNSSRPGLADGTWIKLNIDVVDIFKIGPTQLIARLSGQLTTDNLLTGEQMILGGPETVRGYPTGEYLGDYGYFVSLEWRTPLIPGNFSINKYANWAFFIDHGSVYKNDILPGEEKSHKATGVGAGLRIGVPNCFQLRFDAAKRIAGEEPSDKDDWKYWFQAIISF
ncbi:MAG: ShlB/FhaC/HecB family hemolysin secretion/activation protein [Candidatus Omnitrophica bacterium]|nr:ShlB/FhaC/HecB family hemolysin secretion/activation protein [Candidatus Omnitrophota bacterium]